MNLPESEEPQQNSNLPILLSLASMGVFVILMIVLSGGLLLYVVFATFGVFSFGFLHYLLWGRSLHQSTEGEREEERQRQKLEEDRW